MAIEEGRKKMEDERIARLKKERKRKKREERRNKKRTTRFGKHLALDSLKQDNQERKRTGS